MTKWWIHEFHILEPWNEGHEGIDEKKIIAVKDATYAVAKKRLEKNSGLRDSHLEITMPVRRSSQSQQVWTDIIAWHRRWLYRKQPLPYLTCATQNPLCLSSLIRNTSIRMLIQFLYLKGKKSNQDTNLSNFFFLMFTFHDLFLHYHAV